MRFVIIGNGVAGTEAALAIRRRLSPGQAHITLVGEESAYFFSRTALMYAYMDRLERRGMEPYERAMYERQRIDLCHARVVDMDAGRQEVALGDGRRLGFDRLLIATGSRPRRLALEGMEQVKEGLVHFVSLQDLDACERLTWSTREAVVVGGGLIGVELAECFVHHRLKTSFLVREPWFWPMALAPEEGRVVGEHMRAHGVDLRLEEEARGVEVDAQGRVAAVVTGSGRAMPCQMLGVAIGVEPNVAWLEQCTTPVAVGRGVLVDEAMQTSLPGVYAAGDCAEIARAGQAPLLETIWYAARRQGLMAAASMLGDAVRYEPGLYYNSAKFFDVEFTTVGEFGSVGAGARCVYRYMPHRPVSQRIVEQGGRVVGFNMLGSRWDHEVLGRWIEERRTLEEVLMRLGEAQFDVELGRVPLGGMQEVEMEL